MPGHVVDIASRDFWAVAGLALLLLIPTRSLAVRSWLLAAINVTLLKILLFPLQLVAVLAALTVVWLLISAVGRRWHWRLSLAALCAIAFALFLRHKLPGGLDQPLQKPLVGILASLAFSYVFLRMLDMTRCVAECRAPAPNLPDTINYLVPFHMLAAGPIQSYDDFSKTPREPPSLTVSSVLESTERLSWGLFKKFVLANALNHAFLTGFAIDGWYFLFEVQVFYIWLYLDFSALSDIAVGLGRLLGVATPENFNKPYLARNVINFWDRWHISLSQFIRRNLYFPIQIWLARRTDNAYPLTCSSVAFIVAFALCGLWHAVTIPFVLWGLLHAFALVVTNAYRDLLTRRLGAKGVKAYLDNTSVRAVATVITFEFVAFSLTVFQL